MATTMTTKEFNAIYRKFYNSILNYTNSKLHNIHDSEDVVSKVFTKAKRLIDEGKFNDDLSAIGTFLRTITNSAIIDHIRTDHSNKYVAVSDFVNSEGDEVFQFESASSADSEILNAELHARMLSAFRSLKPNYRKIALMYFIRELTYVEIAEALNVPMGTVKGMLNRCRTILQKELIDIKIA